MLCHGGEVIPPTHQVIQDLTLKKAMICLGIFFSLRPFIVIFER